MDSPSRTSVDRERRGSGDSERKEGKDGKEGKDSKDGKDGKDSKAGGNKAAKAKEMHPKDAVDGELSPEAQVAVAAPSEPAAADQAAAVPAGADSPKDSAKTGTQAGPPKVRAVACAWWLQSACAHAKVAC